MTAESQSALLSQAEILALFVSGAERLENAVRGLSESELNLCPAPGAWSIRQIVHHVADDCDAWSLIIKKAIATPGARIRFEGFPGNEPWAEALEFRTRPIGPSLALVHAHRQYLAALLGHFANAWDQRVAIWSDEDGEGNPSPEGSQVGELSVSEITQMIAEHLLEHVECIQAIKAQYCLDEKLRLVELLDASRQIMRGVLAQVEKDFAIYPPWTIKQVLAHIAGWDDAAVASLRAHMAGDVPATPAVRGIDFYNAQTVAEREALSYEQIVKEWEHAREQFKTVMRQMPPEKFNQPFVFPWGDQGRLSRIAEIFAEHEQEHAEEILGKASRGK